MTRAVQEFLELFGRLLGSEQREAIYEILKRARELEHPPLDDEILAQIADETFQMMDEDEAANGHP